MELEKKVAELAALGLKGWMVMLSEDDWNELGRAYGSSFLFHEINKRVIHVRPKGDVKTGNIDYEIKGGD